MNIEAKDLSKVYNSGENRVVALDHANLEIVSFQIPAPAVTDSS